MSDLPFYKDGTITIEAIVDGVRFEETLRFKGEVSIDELANIRVAWEAGLRRGLALRAEQNQDRTPVDVDPASSRHGRGCGCTPCQAEDWDVIDAGIAASRPASEPQ